MKVLRDHGQQPRYYHHYVGFNSRLDAIQAAVLSVKLPHLDDWAAARQAACGAVSSRIRAARFERLDCYTSGGGELPPRLESVHDSGEERPARCAAKVLGRQKIGAAIYYPVPLHLQKCFAALGYEEGSLPVTEQACREVLSLPVYPELTAAEQGAVINAVSEFCQGQGRAGGLIQ